MKKLEVKSFRGVRNLTLDNLSRFTILAGRNDAGKTSLLESVFYLSGMVFSEMPERIGDSRLMQMKRVDDMRSLFYGGDFANSVKVAATFENGLSREVELKRIEPDKNDFVVFKSPEKDLPVNVPLYRNFRQTYRVLGKDGVEVAGGALDTLCDENGSLRAKASSAHAETWACAYLPTRKSYTATEILKQIVRDKKKGYIVETLHSVDSSITDLELNGDDFEVDVGLGEMVPLGVLGDGLVRMTIILSAEYACMGGGLLLVDEIDNGLHFSAMEKLWRAVVSFARAHDVQVMVTTHNMDFLRAVAQCGVDGCPDDFTYVKLTRRAAQSRAFPFSAEEFRAAIESDMEIR